MIEKLMKQLDPKISMLSQGIAKCMLEIATRRFPATPLGDSLVLGCDANPFAVAIGSDKIGLRPLGVCFNRLEMAAQSRKARKTRSWARFVNVDGLENLHVFGQLHYIFVWPVIDFDNMRDFVFSRLTDDGLAIVAQNMPYAVSDGAEGVVYLNGSGRVCELEESKAVVFSIKKENK